MAVAPWAALRGIRAATLFLTRIPVGGGPYTAVEWRWASGWFPLVGAGIGAIAAGTWWVASPLGPGAAAVSAVAVTVLITGAFHEDGLADTADALGGGAIQSPDRIREILKDSRLGTYGVVALILVLLLRVTLVHRLGSSAGAGLVLSHGLARVPPVALKTWLPYATHKPEARSRDLAESGVAEFVLALACGAVLVLALIDDLVTAISLCVALGVLGLVLARTFMRRLGGYTGDFLGASEQLGEVLVLLVLAALV